jgi:hypothetical protein
MSDNLLSQLEKLKSETKGMPPVHLWNPERVYDIDIKIDKEGRWFHEGSEIKRIKLVKLFASVLKYEIKNTKGNYSLVTPVEQAYITVEDVPFIIVEVEQSEDGFVFRTNLDELIELSEDHPIELRMCDLGAGESGELPYIKVRDDLWARFNRNVYYQAVELAEKRDNKFYLESKGESYLMGRI